MEKSESIFINRELSWLDFDSRVLALAKEKTVPLGERLKFAAIFGSNMDEFFMVRVGSLYDQTLLKNNKTDNVTHMTAAEQIAAITPRVAELQAKCDKYFQHLVSALAQEGYKKVDFAKLAKPQEHFWKTYFQRELLPLLSPQIVDSRHPFPFLNNKDIAQLHTKNEGISYGIVPVSSQFERVLFVKDGETTCFAFVEELIAHYAATIFSASTVQKQCLFRVTRNADITVDEGMMDHDVDFRDVMSELLKKRRKLAAVRLQFWPDAPQEIVKFLRDKLVVPADRCYTQTSPLDSGSLFKLAGRISGDGGHTALFYPAAKPMQAPAGYDLYTEVRKHDVLLAYPYQSIRPFIKMLLRAGADPDVVSIKMTLYRMASDSQIVNALIAAAGGDLDLVEAVEGQQVGAPFFKFQPLQLVHVEHGSGVVEFVPVLLLQLLKTQLHRDGQRHIFVLLADHAVHLLVRGLVQAVLRRVPAALCEGVLHFRDKVDRLLCWWLRLLLRFRSGFRSA